MKKDLSTKLIALLFAIFLWFYIIQVQSPEVDRTIKSVPVQFIKAELEGRDLMLINDKEVTVNVKIRGQRQQIMSIDRADITVMADASDIETTGTHKIYPNIVVPYGNVQVVEQSPSYVTVNVEKILTTDKEVKIIPVGKPKNGYTVGDITGTPDKVTITGAESIISSIAYVAADVDIDGKEEDVSSVENMYFMGTSDTPLNTPYVTMKEETVDVHCEILKKKEVNIEPKFAEGVNTERVRYVLDSNSVKTVEVAGAATVVEELEKIKTRKITKSMISETGEVEVKLSLPEGVRSLDGNTVKLKLKKESIGH